MFADVKAKANPFSVNAFLLISKCAEHLKNLRLIIFFNSTTVVSHWNTDEFFIIEVLN